MWKSRILSALGAVVIVAALAFAVISFAPEALRDGTIHEGLLYESTGIEPDAEVARLGDNTATGDMLAYWMGYECNTVGGGYLDFASNWDYDLGGVTLLQAVREGVTELVKQQLVVENLARDHGIALTDEEQAQLAAEQEEIVAMYGDEAGFNAELAKLGLRPETFARIRLMERLYTKLHESVSTPGSALYPSDEQLLSAAQEREFVTADHILLSTMDPTTGTAADDETVAQKRATAEDLLRQLRESEDPITLFAALADQYSEDPGRAVYPDGYTFSHGEMMPAFEEAAYALGENEISDIVETDYGFHILLRRPLDQTAAADTLRETYFDDYISGLLEQSELVTSPEFDNADLPALYDALVGAAS